MQLKAGKEVKRNKEHLRQKEHKKQAGRLNPTISIITLNANGLNKPLKGRLSDREPPICYLQETCFKCRHKHVKNIRMGKYIPCKS